MLNPEGLAELENDFTGQYITGRIASQVTVLTMYHSKDGKPGFESAALSGQGPRINVPSVPLGVPLGRLDASVKKNRPAEAGRNRADVVGGPSSEASIRWHRLEWERCGSGSAPEITVVAVINCRSRWLRRLREVWL